MNNPTEKQTVKSRVLTGSKNATRSMFSNFWKNGGQFWALATLCSGIIWNPLLPDFTLFNYFFGETGGIGLGVQVEHLIGYAILVSALFGFYTVAKQAWRSTSGITKTVWLAMLAIFGGLLYQTGTITVVGTAMYTTIWLSLTFVLGISSKGSANVFKLFGDRSVHIESDQSDHDSE